MAVKKERRRPDAAAPEAAWPPRVNDHETSVSVMKAIAERQRDLDQARNDYNREVDRLKSELLARTEADRLAVEAGEAALKLYAKAHYEKLFAVKRSHDLAYGSIGFRRSASLSLAVKGDTWEGVLARLEDDGQEEAVRRSKEVNKDVLKGWPASKLEGYGVKLKESERFFVEVAVEKVAE